MFFGLVDVINSEAKREKITGKKIYLSLFFYLCEIFNLSKMTGKEEMTSVTLDLLKKKMDDFAKERDWEKFHSPRNLLLALVRRFVRVILFVVTHYDNFLCICLFDIWCSWFNAPSFDVGVYYFLIYMCYTTCCYES